MCWLPLTTATQNGSSRAHRGHSRRQRKSGSTRLKIDPKSEHCSYHATVNLSRRCLKVIDTFRNVLDRDFAADEPNRKWITDITYLWTKSGWVYLAVVIDLYSRKVVGWAMADSPTTSLVADALRHAIESRRPVGKRLLHHSDRGCQYTSGDYQRLLNDLGVECSMSRVGCCYDNAVAERFFWSLKQEWTNHATLKDLSAARHCVFDYIEVFYNSRRIHKTLNYRSPDQFEAEHTPAVAV